MVFNFVLVLSKSSTYPEDTLPGLTQLRPRCRTILSILKGTHA
jgi:hypothetical protein